MIVKPYKELHICFLFFSEQEGVSRQIEVLDSLCASNIDYVYCILIFCWTGKFYQFYVDVNFLASIFFF